MQSSWTWLSVARYISAHCLFFLLFPPVQFIILALENTVVSRLAINLCDKKEHSVDILLKKDHLSLRVDGTAGESELSISELEDSLSILESSLQSAVKTYVGGLPGEICSINYRLPTHLAELMVRQIVSIHSNWEPPSLFLLEQAFSAMLAHLNRCGCA